MEEKLPPKAMKVVVYAIAKNESKHVQYWHDTTKDADYRFILDTGSTDNTVQLLEELNIPHAVDVVTPFRFNVARNKAIALLPDDVDYCISLDLDERLSDGWRGELQKAYELKLTRPMHKLNIDFTSGNPKSSFDTCRIHPRTGFHWVNLVHENLVSISTGVHEITGTVAISINHYPDNTKSRTHYLTLLKTAAEEDPTNARNCHYLAREYWLLNRWDEAKLEFTKHLDFILCDPIEKAESLRYLAKLDPENRIKYLVRACDLEPLRRESWGDLAVAYSTTLDTKLCIYACERAFEIDPNLFVYLSEASCRNESLYHLASLKYWELRFKSKAFLYALEAFLLNPSNPELRNNVIFFRGHVNVTDIEEIQNKLTLIDSPV